MGKAQTSYPAAQAQGTLTKGDFTEAEGRYIEMKRRSNDTATVRTKAEETLPWLKRTAKPSAFLTVPVGKSRSENLRGFQINPSPSCSAQHPGGQEVAKAKWSAAQSCWWGLGHSVMQGMPPSCSWPDEGRQTSDGSVPQFPHL